MKKFLLTLLGLVVMASLGFTAFKAPKLIKKYHRQKKHHRVAVIAEQEHPFVIIIPSYNNALYCERNLRSVLDQHYDNYRVIYIDDCSKDDTYEKAKSFLAQHPQGKRVTLLRNTTNQGALSNLYRAIHQCADEEIVVTVDGDDFLAHEHVLEKLNKVYADPQVWMTYGNYLDYPTFKQKPQICRKIPKKVVQNASYRTSPWMSSHLRTFYAGLFKDIKLQDFLYQSRFLPMGWDLAFMLPMLEMSGSHARFVSDILYLYNRQNPISDHKIDLSFQTACANHVRSLPHYPALKEKPHHLQKQEKADLVIFSFDRPLQLYALLESVEKFMHGLDQISVIYRSSSPAFANAYHQLSQRFPQVVFQAQSSTPHEDFRDLVLSTVFREESSHYVLFAVDDMVVKDHVNLTTCIEALKETKAYGFYLTYGTHLTECYTLNCKQPVPAHVSLDHQILAWQFKEGEADWNYPNSVDMVVYAKEDIKKDLTTVQFHNPNTMEALWACKAKKKRVGLFYPESKALNIPLNLVNQTHPNRTMAAFSPQDLLISFEKGNKIDISQFYKIKNKSRHIDCQPVFISR